MHSCSNKRRRGVKVICELNTLNLAEGTTMLVGEIALHYCLYRVKGFVLKPPKSTFKHFLTHEHLTAHTVTKHTGTQNIITMGTTRIQTWKKLLMDAVIHQKKYPLLIHFSPSLWGHCARLIKMSTWSNYSTCCNKIQVHLALETFQTEIMLCGCKKNNKKMSFCCSRLLDNFDSRCAMTYLARHLR